MMIRMGAVVLFGVGVAAAVCTVMVVNTEIIPEIARPAVLSCAIGLLLAPAISAYTKRRSHKFSSKRSPSGLAGAILVEAERAFREHGYFKQARFSALYMALHFRVTTDVAKTALAALAADGWLVQHKEDWGRSYELPERRKKAIVLDYGLPDTWNKPVMRDMRREILDVRAESVSNSIKALP